MIESYNVLWFEDDFDWFEEESEQLEAFLQDNYRMKLATDYHAKPSDMKSVDLAVSPDIILVDYNYDLNDRELKGKDIVKEFQIKYPFTTVVFYSANNDFQAQIATQFEGVYFANRKTLFTKVSSLIERSMKNVFSIKNLRNYVISEVAALDTIKIETLAKLLSRTDQAITLVNDTLYSKIITNRVDRVKKLRKKLKQANFADLNLTRLLLANLDAEERKNAIKRYENIFPVIKAGSPLLIAYQEDVLKKRNILAHCQEATDANGNIILKNDINSALPHSFGKDDMLNLRDKIVVYKGLFKRIFDKVNE